MIVRAPFSEEFDRAMGAMLGLAVGDAMGMPSQTMSRAAIREAYGAIGGFVDAADTQPVSAGLKAGTVTDDTEQSLLLAERIIASPDRFDESRWAEALLEWELDTRRRGVNDLLGPSTRRALDGLLRGVPATETGRHGTTNGAAMRIVPLGIATPPEPLGSLVDRVVETCRVTHNSGVAIAAASAVAMIVSAGVAGAGFEAAIGPALAAAREGETRGHRSGEAGMAERIERALVIAQSGEAALDELVGEIRTSVAAIESIPAAFAVVRIAKGDAWRAAVLSANIGDDTDTIGAIAAAMAGACRGAASLPADKVAKVVEVNGLDCASPVRDLLSIRETRRHRADLPERVP